MVLCFKCQEHGHFANKCSSKKQEASSKEHGKPKTCAPIAVDKEKEKREHFRIKLEKEEDCKEQHSSYYGKDKSQITCYKCHDLGHYVFDCQRKNKNKDQSMYSSYKEASTSRLSDKGDTHSITSDDFVIIT
nr:hypothetical protein [Tanacetum cinerariifolium]